MKQQEVLEVLKSGQSVFLTGRAGSGKTHLLNEYISFLREKTLRLVLLPQPASPRP